MTLRFGIGAAAAAVAAFGLLLAVLTTAQARRIDAVAAKEAEAGRYVPVTGGSLHVVVLEPRGPASGRTLLLLHGASANLKDMEESIGRRLAERHRVILIDRPGHGRSDRLGGREMASPARQADAIVEALDKLGVERVVVVAHSWSGALGANLALDHPTRVSGLVLLSPATHPWPGDVAWYNRAAATPVLGQLFVATLIDPFALATFDKAVASVFEPHQPPPNYVERTDARLVLRPGEFQANAQDIADLKAFLTKQAPRYGEIHVPTTIVVADNDSVVSPELHSRALARQVRGSKLVVVSGAGHTTQWNATDRVIAETNALAAQVRP